MNFEPVLSSKLVTLLLNGIKTTGSLNPDDTIFVFEESLTINEYGQIHAFMSWCHKYNRPFGHGNINTVYQEFLDQTEEAVVKRYSYRKTEDDNWEVFSAHVDGCEEWVAYVVTETVAIALINSLSAPGQ